MTALATLVLILGVWNLLVGLYSIHSAFRYRSYAKRLSAGNPTSASPLPSVTLITPCCGEEEGLEENLEALLLQDYPEYRVLFVVESAGDAAVSTIDRLLSRHPDKGELIVAGQASDRSQKVHNLLSAIATAPRSAVLAFADSDGRPRPDWLRHLVRPLDRPEVGAASSYRFYLPEPATFSTLLRSVWNASVLTLLGDHDHNFAWGGATAVRREVFEKIGVARAWKGALSDDYALTHAVRGAALKVEFVPECLVPSRGTVGLHDLFSWTSRQMSITRVYWPALFRVAAVIHVLYTVFLVLAPLAGSFTLLSVVLFLSFGSGGLRALAIADLAPQWRRTISRHFWAYVLMVPIAGFLTLQAIARALGSRRIEWRGKIYEMRSPSETVILGE